MADATCRRSQAPPDRHTEHPGSVGERWLPCRSAGGVTPLSPNRAAGPMVTVSFAQAGTRQRVSRMSLRLGRTWLLLPRCDRSDGHAEEKCKEGEEPTAWADAEVLESGVVGTTQCGNCCSFYDNSSGCPVCRMPRPQPQTMELSPQPRASGDQRLDGPDAAALAHGVDSNATFIVRRLGRAISRNAAGHGVPGHGSPRWRSRPTTPRPCSRLTAATPARSLVLMIH